MTQQQGWKKRLETAEFGFDVDSEKLIPFIESIVSLHSQDLKRKIEEMRKEEKEHEAHSTDEDIWCYTCGESIEEGTWSNNRPYNQALDDVVKILE